ncbi:hypothetical protein PIGHUM_00849 [Pigmentiphaga humi]|uniref:DUF3341 domain-containing protein n=1 Tax=Pigmentiphaga humi TaxID=2478468 RepID=A0A3P4AYZ3_9BURK|nr:DUF3341 domain-containing protein [Pigmentiphaga humi]VCU68791.1 hypothetical protein PIGHUM_00849 [Pigmentiphaga humi]
MKRLPYGVIGQFGTGEALLDAARQAREAGFDAIDAYSPLPVEGLAEVVSMGRNWVPAATLAGGAAGGCAAYFMQWYAAVVAYPVNVGGRPLHNWPAFIPVTFEMTILGAALAAVLAMLLGNGLPALRHPVFDAPGFSRASRDRFFLCIRGLQDEAACVKARTLLERCDAYRVDEVPQ